MVSVTSVGVTDADLLRALHDRYGRALWSYAVGLTGGDHARAEDVVQETLLRAWRHPAVLDETDGSARGWLFTVARRIAIDEWRAARRRAEVVTDEVPEPAVEDTADRAVDRALVRAALATLSADHRQVLLECYIRGLPVAEAAARLGIPPGTVKSRTHYALHALRQAVIDMGGEP